MSCQVFNCENCIHIPDQPLDLRTLVLYTELPKLWEIFQNVASTSPVSTQIGLLTLGNMGAYLKEAEEINVTHYRFWDVMSYFLEKVNKKIIQKRKKK